MTEVIKLNMVRDYWRHADEGLRDERGHFDRSFSINY